MQEPVICFILISLPLHTCHVRVLYHKRRLVNLLQRFTIQGLKWYTKDLQRLHKGIICNSNGL